MSTYKNMELTLLQLGEIEFNLESCHVATLKQICRFNNIKGFSKLKKAELVVLIQDAIKEELCKSAQASKVEVEQIKEPTKAYFHIDSVDTAYEGFTFNNHWNGWACPMFTGNIAQRILDEICESNKWVEMEFGYDKDTDEFWLCENGDAQTMEKWEGRDITYNGQVYHVYDVGAWSWIWDKVDLKDENEYKYYTCSEVEFTDLGGFIHTAFDLEGVR